MKLSEGGRKLIKRFEGCRLEAYRCAAGVWTIGYGHTGDVAPGTKITQHQADVLFDYDVERFEDGVSALPVLLTQPQFDALVSLAFNVGLARVAQSTLLRKLRAGDVQGAASEFMKWKLAAGKVQPGLVRRRAAERELFLSA